MKINQTTLTSQQMMRKALLILAIIALVVFDIYFQEEEPNSCTLTFAFKIKDDDCLKVQEHLKRNWLLQVKDGYVELTPPDKNALGLLRIYRNDTVKK